MELVPEPSQQAAIAHARRLRAEGRSLRSIANSLQHEHGVTLSHVGVASVLNAKR
jgi:hypothetical protein